ncbi:hypothetical protein D3C73_600770 [compost metagenome]
MIEIDQHDHTSLRGNPRQRDETDSDRNRHVEPEPPHQPDATDERERQGEHDDQGFRQRSEIQVEQEENQRKRQRHDDGEPRGRPFEIFELTAPCHGIARWKLHPCRHRLPGLGDITAEIAARDIDIDIDGELAVFGAHGRGTPRQAHLGHFTERNRSTAGQRDKHVSCDRLRIAARRARIADRHAITFTALHGRGHDFRAERHGYDVLHIPDRQTITPERHPVRHDIEIITADHPFRISAGRSIYILQHGFDLPGDRLQLIEIGTVNLHADRSSNARRQHVDAGADRHRPGIGDAGKLQSFVHFLFQACRRHALPPLGFRLQRDDRLEHLDRRGIGRRQCTPGLAEDAFDFRKGFDDPVLRLQ